MAGGRNSAMKTARLYFVEGRVQGVGFRFFVERVAYELGLKGYVRNRSDGRVEVYVTGEEELLAQMRKELGVGPCGARVSRVQEQEAPIKQFQDFSIEPSA